LLGGHGPKALDRVVAYCDGWMPIGMRPSTMKAALAELHKRATTAGRNPNSISVSLFWAPADAAVLAEYAGLGVERAIFPLPPAPRDEVLPQLDSYAKLIH
jgi:alkanesulfonate monooxygenase SsuD/methylene tetrahydromethanopterin reductase-like flavin-dependent oxidoreductase (luciferase family)